MTPSYLYVFRCGNGNYAAVGHERMIDSSREPLHETPEAAIEAALEYLPKTLRPLAADGLETARINGLQRDARAYLLVDAPQEAALEALRKVRSTFVFRHAEAIARAAVTAPTDEAAAAAVHALIGHTSVGDRRSRELALLARRAAGCP